MTKIIGRPQVPIGRAGPFHEGSDLVIPSDTSQRPEKPSVGPIDPSFERRVGMARTRVSFTAQAIEEIERPTVPEIINAHQFIEFTMALTRQEGFVAFAMRAEVLRFGEFMTKAGRQSPYFFNAGLFNHGKSLLRLAEFYADTIQSNMIEFDMLFGPAYKGIPLVSAIAVVLALRGMNVPLAYNRKEEKDHGEGGAVIGAPLQGRVLIVDDVISAGTSVRESVDIIRRAGAEPAGVLIALDRQERGQGELSAVQEVKELYGIPVFSIATLDDIVDTLVIQSQFDKQLIAEQKADLELTLEKIFAYRRQYGVTS